jgi:hypothetical protein
MAKTFTIDDVRAMLLKEKESDEPDAILEILKANEGKKFNVFLLRKLPGGEERWAYDPIAGMTHIKDREYRNERGNGGISLLLSYSMSGPGVVNAAWVEEHNPAFFKGRRERNAKRAACLVDADMCQKMADALTAYAKLHEALGNAKGALDALTGYEQPFSPDSYDWERLCGAREERKT